MKNNQKKAKSLRKGRRTLTGLLAASILLLPVACNQNAPAIPPEDFPGAVARETATVTRQTFHQSIVTAGNAEGRANQLIKWRTSGVIESCDVYLGDSVSQGQQLAKLENGSLVEGIFNAEAAYVNTDVAINDMLINATARAQAEKDLIDAEKALKDAKDKLEGLNYPVANQSEREAAEKTMIGARDAYEIALADFQGVKLRDDVDPEKYEKKQVLQAALNAYFQANNVYVYYQNGVSEITKAQAKAAVLEAQAAYDAALKKFNEFGDQSYSESDFVARIKERDEAQELFNRREQTAPIVGIVMASNCEPGLYVNRDDTAFQITDMSEVYFRVNIPELDRDKLSVGTDTSIIFDALPEKTFTGKVMRIDETPVMKTETTFSMGSGMVTTSSPNYPVLIRVETTESDRILPMMSGMVSVPLAQRENVLSVPVKAVRNEQDTAFVEVDRDGRVEKVVVQLGEFNGDYVEILGGGLREGDRVFLSGGSGANGSVANPAGMPEDLLSTDRLDTVTGDRGE